VWTYYKQIYPSGTWVLFREDDARHQEVFHRQNGWQPSSQLWQRRRKGDIDANDRIGEAEALALIRSLAPPP
jgi:hypothetical protein